MLYRPFVRQRDLGLFNRLSAKLYEKVGRWGFEEMRGLLLRIVIDGIEPRDLDEADTAIDSLPKNPGRVREEEIYRLLDPLRAALLTLFRTRVHYLRNEVVHKDAYRPTASEAAAVLEEAETILYGLNGYLGPVETFDHYANSPRE